MHIPSSMLQGTICPISAFISAVCLFLATFTVSGKNSEKPSAAKFGAVTALIFAMQMINFPVQAGTSGHLIGGVMAAALLGIPFGILSMALMVTIQCLVFSDGGFTVLGMNIFNMAIIGAGLGGIIYGLLSKRYSRTISLGFAAWASVVIASVACSLELGLSGTISFSKVAGSMIGVHSLIGIPEAFLTIGVCYVFGTVSNRVSEKRSTSLALISAGVIATVLSPFASAYPDGLEWVAQKYHFLRESAPAFVSPLSDYSISFFKSEILATALAGAIGVIITFGLSWIVARTFIKKKQTV